VLTYFVHFGKEVRCHNCVVQKMVVLMLRSMKHIQLHIVEQIPYESKSSFQLSVVRDRCCVPLEVRFDSAFLTFLTHVDCVKRRL